MTNETIVLDPTEFPQIPARVALGLDGLGIRVMSAEWGDSDHELFLVKQERGEIPADRHPPNRTVTIKLKAEEDAANLISLAKAAQKLQQKIGRLQDEGGWVKRVLDFDGGYQTNVGMIVHTAVLGGLHGWQMAHRSIAPEITLILTTGPYCYGTKEVAGGEVKLVEGRKLEWELANVIGTAPGIFRLHVKNESIFNWMGAISAMESRDHSNDPTAAMSFEAEQLKLLGEASIAVKATASGGKIVKTGPLSSTWKAFLSSRDAVTGEHMTHIGPRNVLIRAFEPNKLGTLKYKLEWRVLGSLRWIENEAQESFVSGNFTYINFEEVRPEIAALGGQRWEFRILAMTEGTIGEEGEADQVYVLPTEQYAIVEEELEGNTGGAVLWEDHFVQAEGNATGKSAPIGGVYEGAGDTDDFQVAPAESQLTRAVNGDSSINNGRFMVAGNSKKGYTNLIAFIGGIKNIPFNQRTGYLLRYQDINNWVRVCFVRGNYGIVGHPLVESAKIVVEKCVAGVVTTIASTGQSSVLRFGGGINVTITDTGVFSVESGVSTLAFEDIDFATGHTLAEGKVGAYDAMASTAAGSTEKRTFSAAVATTVVSGAEIEQDAVCFAGRGLEFRSDGVYRQHPTDDVWSRLTPDGFLPYAPQSGLEARPLKGILIPSQGNFGLIADAGNPSASAQAFYFPAYHFTSEAV